MDMGLTGIICVGKVQREGLQVGVGGGGGGGGGGRLAGGRCTDHLVGSPEGDDLDVSVLVGDGVAVPQPVKVMHYSTTHHTTSYMVNLTFNCLWIQTLYL